MLLSAYLYNRLKIVSGSVISLLTTIDELKGRWAASVNLHPQTLGRLKQSALITSTGASTRIEGAKLEDHDVERLIQGLSVKKFRDRDIQEVRGYYELLAKIFDSWKTLKFTDGTIKHLHKELLKYVDEAYHKGEYKTKENQVRMIDAEGNIIGTVFDTTPVYLTSIEMHELIQWIQETLREKKYHPLLIMSNFVVQFLKIHPFEDGNGRLSRILTNLLMLQSGYVYIAYISHEKLIEENKVEYYLALRNSQKTFKTDLEDITPWLIFFLQVILKQSQMAIDLISKQSIEQILSYKQLMVWKYLQKVHEAAPGEIAMQTSIARSTVNQILNKLLKLHTVERIGSGSSTRYRKI